MAEEQAPVDLESNYAEGTTEEARREAEGTLLEGAGNEGTEMEDAEMEDARMAGTRRWSGIDMGRAIIMDREVSGTETIVRVMMLDEPENYQEHDSSSPIVIENAGPSFVPAYNDNNGPPVPLVANSRPSFVNMQHRSVSPPVVDNSRRSSVNPICRSSSPMVVDNSRPGFVLQRRSTSPPVVDNFRPSIINLQRRSMSPPVVDSARPSLSVFRFKQAGANAGSTSNPPPRSPSPGRRSTVHDVSSSVMKPTFNSARRSTYTGNFSERKRSVSPVSPGRRNTTGDGSSPLGQQTYASRRRTTTGDISGSIAQRFGSPTGRDGKRSSRMPVHGLLGPVVLSWTNLTVTSRDGKILLDDLSGQVHSGFTAIMGPSGSGKSTLLNTLACRMDRSASVFGKIRLNGKEYTNTDLKQMSGYVMQDDLLNAHLTVDETLWYTVKLKLEPTFTEAYLAERVNTVVKQMGLEHCRRTVIGSPLRRGISGGERKRVAVGMELLTSPQLLFLDEPTSGAQIVGSSMSVFW